MTVENDKYVSIHYILKNDEGAVLDSSTEKTLDYVHGRGYLLPKLEEHLAGKNPGASADAKKFKSITTDDVT